MTSKFGAKFQRVFTISHVKLQNYHGIVWREISRYNKQVKNSRLYTYNLSRMKLKDKQILLYKQIIFTCVLSKF